MNERVRLQTFQSHTVLWFMFLKSTFARSSDYFQNTTEIRPETELIRLT